MSILGQLLQAVALMFAGVLFGFAFLFARSVHHMESNPPSYGTSGELTMGVEKFLVRFFLFFALVLSLWALLFARTL